MRSGRRFLIGLVIGTLLLTFGLLLQVTRVDAQQASGSARARVVDAQVASADVRARETEQKMTDDERFSLVISLSGTTRFTGGVRDKRYPEDAPSTAGYTPGVPRLGIPPLLSSDASMASRTPACVPTTKVRRPCRRWFFPERPSTHSSHAQVEA